MDQWMDTIFKLGKNDAPQPCTLSH